MGIWQPHDFFFSLLWALLSAGIFASKNWVKKQMDNDKEMSDNERKVYQISVVSLRVMGIATAAFGVGTLILPLLDALLTALLGIASNLIDRYGGLAIIIFCVVVWWKNRQPKPPITHIEGDDPVEVEYAKQEAEEVHEDLAELIFAAVVDTSENTPLKRPRDVDGIETGREKPYYMEGMMAVHQFSVDVSAPLEKADKDLAIRELQRHINQRSKRHPLLLRDGHAPVVYDMKDNGPYVVFEVVLYSENYKGKIEARRKARIARQQKQGDINDQDF